MVNRINLLLKAKNITARQFAEEIGIQPSGMSHILSGRNNPSLDFVMKVIRRYPEIDINWLMFGKGEMYEAHPYAQAMQSAPTPAPAPTTIKKTVTAPRVAPQPVEAVQQDLFSQPDENPINEMPLQPTLEQPTLVQQAPVASVPVEQPAVAAPAAPIAATPVAPPAQAAAIPSTAMPTGNVAPTEEATKPERKLIKLLAFYDDHTFVEYRPQ